MSVIWVSGDAENMIVSSADSARTLDALRLPALLDGIGTGDMLLVQGNLSAETTLAACRLAKDAGARVMINPAPLAWDMRDILPLADVLICNLPEALAITGESGEAAARLLCRSDGRHRDPHPRRLRRAAGLGREPDGDPRHLHATRSTRPARATPSPASPPPP